MFVLKVPLFSIEEFRVSYLRHSLTATFISDSETPLITKLPSLASRKLLSAQLHTEFIEVSLLGLHESIKELDIESEFPDKLPLEEQPVAKTRATIPTFIICLFIFINRLLIN